MPFTTETILPLVAADIAGRLHATDPLHPHLAGIAGTKLERTRPAGRTVPDLADELAATSAFMGRRLIAGIDDADLLVGLLDRDLARTVRAALVAHPALPDHARLDAIRRDAAGGHTAAVSGAVQALTGPLCIAHLPEHIDLVASCGPAETGWRNAMALLAAADVAGSFYTQLDALRRIGDLPDAIATTKPAITTVWHAYNRLCAAAVADWKAMGDLDRLTRQVDKLAALMAGRHVGNLRLLLDQLLDIGPAGAPLAETLLTADVTAEMFSGCSDWRATFAAATGRPPRPDSDRPSPALLLRMERAGWPIDQHAVGDAWVALPEATNRRTGPLEKMWMLADPDRLAGMLARAEQTGGEQQWIATNRAHTDDGLWTDTGRTQPALHIRIESARQSAGHGLPVADAARWIGAILHRALTQAGQLTPDAISLVLRQVTGNRTVSDALHVADAVA